MSQATTDNVSTKTITLELSQNVIQNVMFSGHMIGPYYPIKLLIGCGRVYIILHTFENIWFNTPVIFLVVS